MNGDWCLVLFEKLQTIEQALLLMLYKYFNLFQVIVQIFWKYSVECPILQELLLWILFLSHRAYYPVQLQFRYISPNILYYKYTYISVEGSWRSRMPSNKLQYGAFNFLHLGSNEERPYIHQSKAWWGGNPWRGQTVSCVFALTLISEEKRQFSMVLTDAVCKYGFIGSFNELLTRCSIICTFGLRNKSNMLKYLELM